MASLIAPGKEKSARKTHSLAAQREREGAARSAANLANAQILFCLLF
jgi:hypothetical protein